MNSDTRPVALVTGASSGIGAELARELARHGHDLVLTARRIAPMEELAQQLRDRSAAVTVIAADLARPGGAAELAADLAARGLAIDVLVNNAGLGAAGRFDRLEEGRIDEMMQVNIVALTALTRLVMPGMVARGRGRILLLASTAAFTPGPRMAVYFASKAYVLSLGEALSEELRGSGVTVTVLCPGATDTAFFAVAGAENTPLGGHLRHMMTAAEVARIGVDGLLRGRRVVIAGLVNRILALARFLPHALVLRVIARLTAQY